MFRNKKYHCPKKKASDGRVTEKKTRCVLRRIKKGVLLYEVYAVDMVDRTNWTICGICHIRVNTAQMLTIHQGGKLHQEARAGNTFLCADCGVHHFTNERDQRWWCRACQRCSAATRKDHNASRRHKLRSGSRLRLVYVAAMVAVTAIIWRKLR